MLSTWTHEDIDSIVSDVDPGIARAVRVLMEAQVETFESCQGGPDPSRPDRGHAYLEPTVRFHGGPGAGWLALSALLTVDLPVESVRRIWPLYRGEPTGPHWEVTFSRLVNPAGDDAGSPPVTGGVTLASEEIGGDECGDLLPGDENLPLSRGSEDPDLYTALHSDPSEAER